LFTTKVRGKRGMKLVSVKLVSRVLAGAICCAGVIALTCGGPTASKTTNTTSVDSLVITNQMTGWVLDSSVSVSGAAMMPFTNSTANDFVDGGKTDYCGKCDGTDALKDGMGTYLKEPLAGHTRKLEVFVLDYGSASAAVAEFNVWVKKDSGMTSETITLFPTTTAIGFDLGGGVDS